MHDPAIPPELAARITAARATLADFNREAAEFIGRGGPQPDHAAWSYRLAGALATVLNEIGAHPDQSGIAQPGGGWISGPSQ